MKGKKKKKIGLPAFKKAVSHSRIKEPEGYTDITSFLIGGCGCTVSFHLPTTRLNVVLTHTPLPLSRALALWVSPVTPLPLSVSSFRSLYLGASVMYQINSKSHFSKEGMFMLM
jgi:hypothetical protein